MMVVFVFDSDYNNRMLKRRRRIQKYISALKQKKRGIDAEDVDKLKIEDEDNEVKPYYSKKKVDR